MLEIELGLGLGSVGECVMGMGGFKEGLGERGYCLCVWLGLGLWLWKARLG